MKFTANIKDLKRALSIISLAVGDASETINGHALFDVNEGSVFLYSTNNDKMCAAHLPIGNLSPNEDVQFTADPKRIHKIINSSDSDSVKFSYDKSTKTLNIHASEVADAYVSFASFDPEGYLTFDKDLESAKELKTVNAKVFLAGLKFTQGFLPDNDADKKYSNLFITGGAMKGSNGAFKVGAFVSDDLMGIEITLRRLMLSAICSLIDISDAPDITIAETTKLVVISTKDMLNKFAFRKTTIAAPKLPISLTAPESESVSIERSVLLKKLNRLSIVSKEDSGIKIRAEATDFHMETMTDRKSYEKMPCVGGQQPIVFVLECNKFKAIMGVFLSTHVDISIDKTKCNFFSSGTLLIEEPGKEPVSKPYTTVGIQSIGKVL